MGGALAGDPEISTPDRRVRVFVSSTLEELADDRRAARTAITGLHLTPVMFEVGARSHSARDLYRGYLQQSDVFVGIYGQRYGWVAPQESVSGLEDEYLRVGDRPKLIYVKDGIGRDPRLQDLLRRIEADDQASYKHFGGADELVDLLSDDLAVLLTERFARSVRTAPVTRPSAPLPAAPTGIVGRADEIRAVGTLLRDPAAHLITLIGPGGIGKTRLALEVARQLRDEIPAVLDEVAFIDLAAVVDPELVPGAVAAALGIRPEGARPVLDLLVDRLQGRRLLLVLDNVEQLVSAAPALARLLAACPDVTVLTTSRIALRLRGEREVALAPLPTPPDGSVDIGEIGESAAVRLLVARARQVRPGFVLTAANAAAVAELCRRLDGIPLALELAAAQLRLLTPAALLRRLGDTLDLGASAVDTPDRQRTLRATIEWSHGLLGPAEQALFARLSVFSGAWTIEASDAVARAGSDAADLDSLDTLVSLVAQSLVRTDESDPEEPRFRMLSTIRAYAAERLVERDEVDATSACLARYLLGVVAAVRDDLQGARHKAAADRLDRERDEILSAIDWALRSDDADTVGRLLTPLFTYWWSRGLLAMTHGLAEAAAALPSASGLSPYASALLLGARGMAMVMVGQNAAAEPLLRCSFETATELGNGRLRAYALLGLAMTLVGRTPSESRQGLDDAIEAFRALSDRWGLALAMSIRGNLALEAGDPVAARTLHLEGLAAAEAIDNDHLRAQLLDMLGLDAVGAGDQRGARERFGAAAELHTRLLDYEGSAYGLAGLAGLALAQHRPEVSARLIGASGHLRQVIDAAVWPGMQAADRARTSAVSRALGAAAFTAAAAVGAQLSIPDALAYGLAATSPVTAPVSGDPEPGRTATSFGTAGSSAGA